MKKLKAVLLISFLVCISGTSAQSTYYFKHYSTEDGLPQFTITDMLQDHKGFMWFATWDGFSKFDGNTFRNFKTREDDTYQMESNRIRHIYEDKSGYIWLHSYDDEAHRFDPYTETFKGLKSFAEYRKSAFKLSQIEICPSGRVWLLSEKNGCICVADSLFTMHIYNKENNNLKGNITHKIIEDAELNTWILTNNGISRIKNGETEPSSFFFENEIDRNNQSFRSAIEFAGSIWFGSNKGKIWKYTKNTEQFNLIQVPTKSELTDFRLLSESELLITSSDDGFFIYNLIDHGFEHYNTNSVKELKSNKIRALFWDSYKQFWFETEGLGIYKFDTETRSTKYFVVEIDNPAIASIPPASDILEDINGQIWVHPRGGGFSRYNRKTDSLEPFYNDESSPNWRFSNILHSLYSDKQGNLWFCTRSHGLEKVSFGNDNFKVFKINRKSGTLVTNEVRAVLQDKENKLWVATKDKCLNIYDEQYNHIGSLSDNGEIGHNNLFSGIVYSMMQDNNGHIWLGTRTDGLFKLKKTNNPRQYQIEHFKKDENDPYSLSEDVVYSIYQDSGGNIWVGTYGGGLNLIRNTKEGKTLFINHKNNLKNYPIETGHRIRHISENSFGNICVGTTSGLIMFSSSFSLPEDIAYKHYVRVAGNKESLSSNDIHGTCHTHSGDMYLVTFGGGLNKVVEYDDKGFPLRFKPYTMQNGLPSDVCFAALEDEEGKLWISMENNLSRFDPVEETFETFAEIKQLMSKDNFSEASACRLSNNEFVFGYTGGILHFPPEEIKNNHFKPYVALSEFRLHNRLVPIGNEHSPLSKHIDDINHLTLSHNRNSFSITYAALDFVLPDNILYAYKLEGFDADWIYNQKERVANYTNIPKGEYIFKLKSTNSEGQWIANERMLPIKVLPSFWESSWAIIIYIALLAGLIYLTIRVLFTFYRLRKSVEMEKYLSEMKLRFFTDISHEIRTPLTMISSPVDYLLTDDEIPERAKVHLNSISQNANRMLRLVNQILDLRKIQQSKLKVQETNIGELVETICHNFDEVAHKNQIHLHFINEAKDEKVWVATESFEIIMMNLLSNAFKYTPNGRAISVTVRDTERQIILAVRDEGCGIAKEKQKELFTRFASFNEDKSKPSTGIGLSIVKDLIDKHSGKITVISEPGKGSTFTIYLIKGTNHFDANVELIKTKPATVSEKVDEPAAPKDELPEREHAILVIEDNIELRQFIRTILEHDYHIIEAGDGMEGLEKAQTANPDFIVSDIMMPQMDGIELLKRLKEDINTCHIPVILLTAKSAIESKLEGLIHGADDYITKPFSVQYFRARINNLLDQRKRLQDAFRLQLTQPKEKQPNAVSLPINPQDESLMNNIIQLINAHIDNSEFTIDDLSAAIGMSRSVFSNKVKSLTGLTPFEFIRDLKLKKAAQLLASGSFMVKEVSYMIGISDTKHFGKIFKAKFGVTPQEYKNTPL